MIPILIKFFPVGKIAKLIVYTVIFTAAIGSAALLASDVASAQETPTPTTEDGSGDGITIPVDVAGEDSSGTEEQAEEDPFEGVIFEFDSGLLLHGVEYDLEDGVAHIYVSVPESANSSASFLIVDGTLTEDGEPNTITSELEPSQERQYTLNLYNAGGRHISIWSDMQPYYDFGEPDTNYNPGGVAVVATFVGALLVILLFVSLEQYSNRSTRTPEREV